MFQQFANYLLGSLTNNENTTEAPATITTTTSEGVENNNLKSFETDDEWILIDRDSEGNSEISSLEDLNIDNYEDDDNNNANKEEDNDVLIIRDEYGQRMVVTTTSSLLPLPSTVFTQTTSLPSHISMEESWFLTPPPCFISTGPIDMHISPLENLLIEHPSMSVYTHHNRRYNSNNNQTPTTRSEIGDDIDEDHVVVVDNDGNDGVILNLNDNDNEQVVVVRRIATARRINHLQILQQQQQQQVVKYKQGQKVQVKNSYKMMQRNYLNRNNKAREVNCRNHRQRRSERTQGNKRSYVNNNRKC